MTYIYDDDYPDPVDKTPAPKSPIPLVPMVVAIFMGFVGFWLTVHVLFKDNYSGH